MSYFTRYLEQAKQKQGSIVFPEGHDERVLQAAGRLRDEGLGRPILLGQPEKIEAASCQAGISLESIEVLHPASSERLERYAAAYRQVRPVEEKVARRVVGKPLCFGGMMVASGDADTLVAGAATATAIVIQAGVLTIGFAPGIKTVSSFFLMVLPQFAGREEVPLLFADCAVNVAPDAQQLADIAVASHASALSLLEATPRVAMLSFSTCGSAEHADVQKVRQALQLARQSCPDALIDGEFQADTALMPDVAQKKMKRESPVAGQANVLIFPDLNSGNLAYKLTQHLAGARAIGPFLQGLARPISDLSRGASVEEIVQTAVLCLARCLRY